MRGPGRKKLINELARQLLSDMWDRGFAFGYAKAEAKYRPININTDGQVIDITAALAARRDRPSKEA